MAGKVVKKAPETDHERFGGLRDELTEQYLADLDEDGKHALLIFLIANNKDDADAVFSNVENMTETGGEYSEAMGRITQKDQDEHTEW